MTTLKLGEGTRTVDIKKTSSMLYPLEAPIGWFLQNAQHQHVREGDHYMPQTLSGGSWTVTFQKTTGGVTTASGQGHSLEEAWANATKLVERNDG